MPHGGVGQLIPDPKPPWYSFEKRTNAPAMFFFFYNNTESRPDTSPPSMLSLVQRVTLSSLLLSKKKYLTSAYQKFVSQITISMIAPPAYENVKMTGKL